MEDLIQKLTDNPKIDDRTVMDGGFWSQSWRWLAYLPRFTVIRKYLEKLLHTRDQHLGHRE